MSGIPGLCIRPEIDEMDDGKTMELLSFDLNTYAVPDNQRYGYCRLLSDFQRLGNIGTIPFGLGEYIYKVKDKRENRIVLLRKMEMPPSYESIPCPTLREINIMKSLKHENIVKIIGAAVGRSFESTYLILEYCEYDLSFVLDDDKAKAMIEESHLKYIMYYLYRGLKYIHNNRVIHKDISCLNIVFTPDGTLKISNFGSACRSHKTEVTSKVVACRWYKAPELLFGATKFTSAVDMWSSGCILGELFLKSPLFRGETDMVVMNSIVELLGTPSDVSWPGHSDLPLYHDYDLPYQQFNNLWKFIPYESQILLHLLNNLLVYNPNSRTSAEECLQHEYFYQSPVACAPSEILKILEVSQELLLQF